MWKLYGGLLHFHLKNENGQGFRSAEVQNYAREISCGLKLNLDYVFIRIIFLKFWDYDRVYGLTLFMVTFLEAFYLQLASGI